MIPVSKAWKAAQNEILFPELLVEITYGISEPGLQEEAVASANYPEPYSDLTQITSRRDKNGEKYATLEYGCWGLDGSFGYSDGSPTDVGYVDRNFSGADCSMKVSPYPTITLDFKKRHDLPIPGLIIEWDKTFNGWATDFRISAYNSSELVTTTTVVGNTSIVSEIVIDIANYSKITIEILKWSHPYQRVKCTDIYLGLYAVYTKTDLLGFDHKQSVDLLSAKLPESMVSFRLRNDDERWNPDAPSGIERYLLEQQEIRVRYGMNHEGSTEWIKGGTFWISEWNTPTNGIEADFTARDAIEFMGGEYTGPRTGTLYDIAIAAFEEANLTILDSGEKRYVVDDSLKNIYTDFSTDNSDYVISEVLQMIANAGGCVFYQDRDGVVHIKPRSLNYSDYRISGDISYAHPEYTINKPLKSVSVNYGTERQSIVVDVRSSGEIQKVKNPIIMNMEDAVRVGNITSELLKNRKVISGDFRADMRLDALDNIMVISKYASNIICVTDIEYSTTGGAFRGKYTGRVVSINLGNVPVYSNEFRSGEIW